MDYCVRVSTFAHFIIRFMCIAHIQLLVGHSLIVQIMGVFGASVLCLHDPLDLIKGFVIDDLHCLFLGVTKHMLSIKSTDHDFYSGNKVRIY